jgi:hypothetical protein
LIRQQLEFWQRRDLDTERWLLAVRLNNNAAGRRRSFSSMRIHERLSLTVIKIVQRMWSGIAQVGRSKLTAVKATRATGQ